jgi:Caspase domain/Ankyrin repeats (3 copies)/Ankyrin repeat
MTGRDHNTVTPSRTNISLASLVIAALLLFFAGCGTGLTQAARDGDIASMQKLLDGGANINENGMAATYAGPPLSHAAYACQVEAARYLISRGADVNATGTGAAGQRPLHVAARYDCVEVAKLLLDAGADINLHANSIWGSPLTFAASEGNTKMIKFLIERGADVDDAIDNLQKLDEPDDVALLERYEQRAKLAAVRAEPVAPPVILSDVDDLPQTPARTKKNAYAVVIGIERYRQHLPKADFAVHDAKTVAEYLTKVLGYPKENVVTLLNDEALKSDFEKYFEKWLGNNVEKDSTVFIYYSGHGAPDLRTGSAYLVPYDGDPSFIDETGYSLKRMYAALAKLPAKEIIVALDSCFSGAGGRSVIAKGARPLVLNLQNTAVLSPNVTVLAASSGDQISSTYEEKGHGLFTYFLLKGIRNEDVVKPDGSLAIDELYSYVKPQVERIARKQYNNEQTPQLIEPKKN